VGIPLILEMGFNRVSVGSRRYPILGGEIPAPTWMKSSSKKIRIDKLLADRGLAPSREKAQALILAGVVFVNSRRVEKASETFEEDTPVEMKGEDHPYVSRGGVKLKGALEAFQISVKDKTCLDIGASTGGFTDCLLQEGAKQVYAVDVGYGQFHYRLREDPRVVLFERANFRQWDHESLHGRVDLIVIDVSFISLTKILPRTLPFLRKGGELLTLVKPQFELSPAEAKKGVVRSEVLQKKAVLKIDAEAKRLGLRVLGEAKSVLKGPQGNQEYFLHLKSPGDRSQNSGE
jgi:23S rRNA (cytidine1920-2'-O)/16S rRNA (cytidine1409-2'-O)-methyltransferase